VNVKQTPDININNTATLASWVDANALAILNLKRKASIEVPLKLNGKPFRAGAITNSIDVWNSSAVNRHAMFRVAMNTCNGCHGAETATSFLHIGPREPGTAAPLSAFLTGATTTGTPSKTPIAVADPRDRKPVRHFNELMFRVKDIAAILCPEDIPKTTASTAVIEEVAASGRPVTGDLHRGPSVGLAH
jgi:hypothetical protein